MKTDKNKVIKRRLRVLLFSFMLLVIAHVFLYIMGIYHPEVKLEWWIHKNYEDVVSVETHDLAGTWVIGALYYEAVYCGMNANMEGWRDSELILRPDKTFTFKPILFYITFIYDGMSEDEVNKLLDDFRSKDHEVLHGKWSLEHYYPNPSSQMYSIVLNLHVINPGHAVDTEDDSNIIYLGRIIRNDQKYPLDQYRIIRTLSSDSRANTRSFFYRRISNIP